MPGGLENRAQDPLLAVYLERRADLIRYFRSRLGSNEAAEELVQDIFLKIARRRPEAIENPAAYLFRLGSNLMLDRLKQERRSQHRAQAFHSANHADERHPRSDEPSAEDALAARQRLALIIEAVKALPAPAQEAFRLHKLQGLSHAETAAAMGVSRSSVEKHLMACLKHILLTVRA